MNKTQRQKIILVGIIGFVLFIFCYNLLLRPAFARLSASHREVISLKREISAKKALINNLPNISKEFSVLKEKADFVEKSLPNEKEIPGLLEELSRIAEESNVKILKIKPQEIAGVTPQVSSNLPYIEQPISIEAKSGFHELGRFLENLENLNRFVKIRQLNIVGDRQDVRHHNIKLEMSTYVLR